MFKFFTSVLVFCLTTVCVVSQTTFELEDTATISRLNLQDQILVNQPVVSSSVLNNLVFVEQMGSGNSISLDVISSKSNIEINQSGTGNFIDLEYHAQEINSLVVQNGANNRVTDFSLDPQKTVNTIVTQNGNNLEVQKFGSNSISNGLQIHQTGSFKTIIVNSF
ncbi:hypothetical protein [Patiriisocius sp. Uisw_017]|jgi:hypothetical protein|uniref:hypothetical protein n=1 Tax=Patiriisocius sp. Uisw_017 TaxID=3230968 RepID=UPI0039ED3A2B